MSYRGSDKVGLTRIIYRSYRVITHQLATVDHLFKVIFDHLFGKVNSITEIIRNNLKKKITDPLRHIFFKVIDDFFEN